MMNEQQYIDTGILNDYCLGLLNKEQQEQVEENMKLYPVIRVEVDAINSTLEQYATSYQTLPAENLKERIWKALENITREERISFSDLPLLTKFSDSKNWLKLIRPLLIEKVAGQEFFIKVLRDDKEALQSLVWSSVNYPDEVHDDMQESFIVLEGSCECFIGKQVIRMGPGDFMEIPMHTHHDVKLLSPYLMAIVQRRKIA
ncbi:MAG: cupin domain-containing protein [Chitinophagaceae bacterium]